MRASLDETYRPIFHTPGAYKSNRKFILLQDRSAFWKDQATTREAKNRDRGTRDGLDSKGEAFSEGSLLDGRRSNCDLGIVQ